jgi:hypothetical protein
VPPLFAELERDDRGVRRGLLARRAILCVLLVVPVLALIGLLGQRHMDSQAAGAQATLRVRAPKTVRGGLFFESRLQIHVLGRIQHPRLVLDQGWLEGMQINSIEPSAQDEDSRNGRLVLAYSTWLPGERKTIWLEFQVNPTNLGHRSYGIELDDANTKLARVDRTLTVLP